MRTTINYLMMLLVIMSMSVFAGCGDDKDEPVGNLLAGTNWEYIDVYEDGTFEYVLRFFSDNTATYEVSRKNAGGIIVETFSNKYIYQQSGNLVILSAQQAGKANLEATITQNIKMELVNTSTDEKIGVFYKK